MTSYRITIEGSGNRLEAEAAAAGLVLQLQQRGHVIATYRDLRIDDTTPAASAVAHANPED